MIASSARPDSSSASTNSRCVRDERCAEQQLGHAEDAVERRANLVADVGEELVLGERRLLGGRSAACRTRRYLPERQGDQRGQRRHRQREQEIAIANRHQIPEQHHLVGGLHAPRSPMPVIVPSSASAMISR